MWGLISKIVVSSQDHKYEKNQEGLGPLKPGANVVLPPLLKGPTHTYVYDMSMIVGTLSKKKLNIDLQLFGIYRRTVY